MTFKKLKRVMALVEPYLVDDDCIGAERDEVYIQVGALPQKVAEKLEALDVFLESGILTTGGTLTLFT